MSSESLCYLKCSYNSLRAFWVPHPTILIGSLLIAPIGSTQEVTSSSEDSKYLIVALSDKSHDWVSGKVDSLASNIDTYFASGTLADRKNTSYVSVQWTNTYSHLNYYDNRLKVRGRLDLPGTKERFNLFFDSDPEEHDSLSSRVLRSNRASEKEDGVLGIGLKNKSSSFKVKHGIGLSSGDPIDVFYRFKLNYNTQINDHWESYFSQYIWHYHQKSWGERTQGQLTFKANEFWEISTTSEAQYEHRYKNFEFAQIFSLHRYISNSQNLQYNIGALATDKPDFNVTDYFLSFDYRQRMYKDWLYMSVVPELLWIRGERIHVENNDFRKKGFDPTISLHFEIIFSGQPEYRYRNMYKQPAIK
ncbi:hypothetical protein MARGE09_P4076 [Marinagarivorans cellulosilyticus]|uniref:Uncharacterized protein n=1 Tax=Marinagarivorans cellulosilyticus TaxID=2721545 RepID=A0AAN2BM82_9GAMM|nr:hypothetical protein MARGE09_P4076 [Marinagarivorans cellulosilyticus]